MLNLPVSLWIDADRLLADIETLAAVDRREDGSCCRLALSDGDRAGRDLLVGWMREAELAVHVDAIGNIFGIRAGEAPGPAVMTGSHIDTVATGGRFDGAYGVVAGLAAIRALNDAAVVTRHPLAVAAFTNEEGARFAPDMMGSLVFAGGMALRDALDARDADGLRLGDELARIGYAGSARGASPRAFIELHIEQGPILDRTGDILGAVEDLQAISWQEVIVTGVPNHAGTTPMALRRDAGHAAARIAVFVRDLVRRIGGGQVGTVGKMRLMPNLINVIAGEARLGIDLRNTDDRVLRAAETSLADFLIRLADEEELTITARTLVRTEPVHFDRDILATIERVASDLGQPIRRMTSGAGHDAQMVARLCPAAMIFVPSIAGISHNPREDTEPAHLELGANVLLHSLLQLANED